MINVAIIGYGVVGSGVYEVITNGKDGIAKKIKQDIDVKRILDIRDFDDHPRKEIFTKSFEDIINDENIDIVVETMGGIKYAYDYTKRALMAGKAVVTSNKELVATHGAELLKIAYENNVNYLFEASVGGGIPIVRPLSQCLAANKISRISGILNGTTNYILTSMFKNDQEYSVALKMAQKLGYAERDPSSDVDGLDTCRKIAILTSQVYGAQICAEKIPTEGIRNITKEDMLYAEKINCTIKLIGYSKIEGSKVIARVCPMLIPKDNQLYTVEDVFNGILVEGNAIGEVMFYGRGAGKLPTASAVVADIIDIANNSENNGRFFWTEEKEDSIANESSEESVMFVRVKDTPKESVKEQFGDVIFIEGEGEYGFITPLMKEEDIDKKLSGLEVISKIRMYIYTEGV